MTPFSFGRSRIKVNALTRCASRRLVDFSFLVKKKKNGRRIVMKNERERERKRGKGFLTENRVKKNNTIKKLEGRKLSL